MRPERPLRFFGKRICTELAEGCRRAAARRAPLFGPAHRGPNRSAPAQSETVLDYVI